MFFNPFINIKPSSHNQLFGHNFCTYIFYYNISKCFIINSLNTLFHSNNSIQKDNLELFLCLQFFIFYSFFPVLDFPTFQLIYVMMECHSDPHHLNPVNELKIWLISCILWLHFPILSYFYKKKKYNILKSIFWNLHYSVLLMYVRQIFTIIHTFLD